MIAMKDSSREILEYISRHKAENGINNFTVIELPNRNGISYLASHGYIVIKDFGSRLANISITSKGLDWVRENITLNEFNISEASLKNGVVTIKIRSDLYAHIEKYIQTEDYFHAVEESYKFVREKLKALTGSEKATQAFGYDANTTIDYACIFSKNPSNAIEEDFFKGVKFLHLAVQFLRNEKSHSLATVIDKNLALHYISIASLSYDLISRDNTEVVES